MSSTQETLDVLTVIGDWQTLLQSDSQVATVFVDVCKAFNSVPHQLIIDSLAKIGVCGPLQLWCIDYLTDQQQCVVLNRESSDFLNVTSGVPQGSILGLFLLFYI